MKKEVIQGEDELMQIMLSVPKNTVKLEIHATVMDDETDELYVMTNKMPTNEVIDARISYYLQELPVMERHIHEKVPSISKPDMQNQTSIPSKRDAPALPVAIIQELIYVTC